MPPSRILPLVVAVALFMENVDSTVIATSLPAIAADLGTSPVALKLALTSYLLSLAVFIPISGWAADRFGARVVFRAAILVFVAGSVACAFAGSLAAFVAARLLQGIGGAMMTPVGRLVLMRSVPKSELVDALAWYTMPALVGPLMGPPLGGFITTYFGWHWIFWINVPIGLAGILLASRYIPDLPPAPRERLDRRGFAIAALAGMGLIFGASVASLEAVPVWIGLGLIALGFLAAALYVGHARRTAQPILDLTLLRLPTFRASVTGGSLFRIGVGALPFLLPLLLQLGFGLSPLQSGLITFSAAAGAFVMKALAAPILRRFGFRRVMVVNALVSSVFIGASALFTPTTPVVLIMAVLLVGGFFRSLQFTSISAIAYADVEPAAVARATALSAVAQQVSLSFGVAAGAAALELAMRLRGDAPPLREDFAAAFLIVAAISAISALAFARMPADAGRALAGGPGPAERLPEGEPAAR